MTYFGIQCALSEAEARTLTTFALGHRVVECGALLGASTMLMAQVAASVVSVDRHEGYGPSTLREFYSNYFRVSKATERVVPIIADVLEVLPHLKADRYFLDLDGTYETTRGALERIPSGVLVAVHDVRRSKCAGVERAILDAGYSIDSLTDTLAIIRRTS